ncbi:MAG: HAD-IA family hydrolase [Gemmatimonadales bacterium]
MPLTTFLFDLDGTLIDSVRLILDSYHYTTTKHGLPARTDAEWLVGLGTPLSAQFAPYADTAERMAELIASYREYNLSHHDAQITAYPGVVEAVHGLVARGIRLGLVTSKNRSGAERGLRVVGLDGAFPVIVGSDEVVNAKPHPEPVLKAMTLIGATAESTIYIGDSTHDMESGRAAGVQTAAVLWGPFTRKDLLRTAPDHWLERPAQLLELLKG